MFPFGLACHTSHVRVQKSDFSGFNCRATFVTLKIYIDECDAAFYYVFFLLLTIVHTSRVCHNNKISGKDCKTPSVKQRCCHEQTWIFTSKKRFHWGMYNEVVSTLRCHYTRFSHTLKLDQGIIFLIFFSGANVFGGCWRFSSTGWWKGCQVINIP